MRKKLQVIKILIVVFSVLLAIGISALAGILLFGRTERVTGFDSVTDNYILPSSSESAYNGMAGFIQLSDAFLPQPAIVGGREDRY